MKKPSEKKLRLMRSVVRGLTRPELQAAVGGRIGNVGCAASCISCTRTALQGANDPCPGKAS